MTQESLELFPPSPRPHLFHQALSASTPGLPGLRATGAPRLQSCCPRGPEVASSNHSAFPRPSKPPSSSDRFSRPLNNSLRPVWRHHRTTDLGWAMGLRFIPGVAFWAVGAARKKKSGSCLGRREGRANTKEGHSTCPHIQFFCSMLPKRRAKKKL